MNKTAWMASAGLALAAGLSGCKSNETASTAPSVSTPVSASGVSAPVAVTWRRSDKTAEFLSAFRPQQ